MEWFEQRCRAEKDLEIFVKTTCGDRPPSHNDGHMRKVKNNSLWIVYSMLALKYLGAMLLLLCFKYGLAEDSDHAGLARLLWPGLSFAILLALTVSIRPLDLILVVKTVSWLHDVADHKYCKEDPSLKAKVEAFLDKFTHTHRHLIRSDKYRQIWSKEKILQIIERISFSRQKNLGTKDWMETLGEQGLLVRNIVSDADKWEAIGEFGIKRCLEYQVEDMERKNQHAGPVKVHKAMVEHYHEKLKLLASQEFMFTLPGLIWAKWLDREMQGAIEENALRAYDAEGACS